MGRTGWWSPKLWKALWIAMMRSRRDARARKDFLRIAAYLVLAFGWIGYSVIRLSHLNPAQIDEIAVVVVGIVIAGALLFTFGGNIYKRFKRRREERRSPAVSVELKRALYNETCLLATLLERMSSEAAMEKVIPPEIEIITRRVLLDRLSALGLREGLEP